MQCVLAKKIYLIVVYLLILLTMKYYLFDTFYYFYHIFLLYSLKIHLAYLESIGNVSRLKRQNESYMLIQVTLYVLLFSLFWLLFFIICSEHEELNIKDRSHSSRTKGMKENEIKRYKVDICMYFVQFKIIYPQLRTQR